MELTWEDNGGGSMGSNTLLRLDGKCVGHFYEDASKGIDCEQVRDDIETRYNAHGALVAALEDARKWIGGQPVRSTCSATTLTELTDSIDAALALARSAKQ